MGGVFAIVVNRICSGRASLAGGVTRSWRWRAVFGAASRATFAFIVFAFEITRDYNAILPLMLGCVIADLIALRYLPDLDHDRKTGAPRPVTFPANTRRAC